MELYIHIPFCERKCAYCDFLSAPAGNEQRAAYMEALHTEIGLAGIMAEAEDERITSIFIGGGTPSILPAEMIEKLMAKLRRGFQVEKDAEITIEANPGTTDGAKLAAYKEAGINRISFGCQSTVDAELATLGRIHTYATFVKEYEAARRAGFDNISVDLMSAIPGQTRLSLAHSLRSIASLAPEHISVYSLILEEGTPFYADRASLALPDEETQVRMYDLTGEILAAYGYRQYEISNYAKPGYTCRHNIGYWRRVPYLGLGIGAASLMHEKRFHNTPDIGTYIKLLSEADRIAPAANKQGTHCGAGEAASRRQDAKDPSGILGRLRIPEEELDWEGQMAEYMILGLRMTAGVERREFYRLFGVDAARKYKDVIGKYERLSLLVADADAIRLTQAGIEVSNVIMADFL